MDQLHLPFVDYVAEVVGAVLENPRATAPLEKLFDRRLQAAEERWGKTLGDLLEERLRKVLLEKEEDERLLDRAEAARYLRVSIRSFERMKIDPDPKKGPSGQLLWQQGRLKAHKEKR